MSTRRDSSSRVNFTPQLPRMPRQRSRWSLANFIPGIRSPKTEIILSPRSRAESAAERQKRIANERKNSKRKTIMSFLSKSNDKRTTSNAIIDNIELDIGPGNRDYVQLSKNSSVSPNQSHIRLDRVSEEHDANASDCKSNSLKRISTGQFLHKQPKDLSNVRRISTGTTLLKKPISPLKPGKNGILSPKLVINRKPSPPPQIPHIISLSEWKKPREEEEDALWTPKSNQSDHELTLTQERRQSRRSSKQGIRPISSQQDCEKSLLSEDKITQIMQTGSLLIPDIESSKTCNVTVACTTSNISTTQSIKGGSTKITDL